MKRIITILLFILFPFVCSADFDARKWEYYKDVESVEEGLNIFAVDDELFSGTSRDLRDLRIIASDNSEVPYKLVTSQKKSKNQVYYPKMINNSSSDMGETSVVLDFGVNNQGIDRIKINTSNKNFQRQVSVYGSDSAKEDWNLLSDSIYIYDYTDKRAGFNSQDTTIDFSETIFQYVKIVVSADSEIFKINSVSASYTISQHSRQLERIPTYTVQQNKQNNTSEVLIDLNVDGVPTNKAIISVTDKNFRRGVQIYSSFDNQKWRNIGSGYIFRYNTDRFRGENLVLNFAESGEQYLKFVIQNYDDKPLTIKNVKTFSTYREVVFQAEDDLSYKVYYGNQKTRFPQYDLDSYFKYLDLSKANQVNLSEQMDNTSFIKKEIVRIDPKSEKIPHLMSISLVIASLLLLFLVYRFFQVNK